MELSERLQYYFEVANNHIKILKKSIEYIKPFYPFKEDFFKNIEDDTILFALDSLVFRFAKLQDWLGKKIFKSFLEFEEFPVDDLNFYEIVKILEKEKILNIDLWAVFREIRNKLGHDYPDFEHISDNINFIIENSNELIEISLKLEEQFNKIKELKNAP